MEGVYHGLMEAPVPFIFLARDIEGKDGDCLREEDK
jgi:hypothetical protein